MNTFCRLIWEVWLHFNKHGHFKSGQGRTETVVNMIEIVGQYDVSSVNVWIPVTIRRQILKSDICNLVLYHFAIEAKFRGKKRDCPNAILSITINKTKPENFKTIHIFQKSLYNYYSPEHNFLKIVRQQFHINHNIFN